MALQKVLLVGNGINNLDQDFTWRDLIDDLIDYVGATGQIKADNKPFPLLYEGICLHGMKTQGMKEIDIKKHISKKVSLLMPNKIHSKLIQIGFDDILTTNYDYTLETSTNPYSTKLNTNDGVVDEAIYSIFRQKKQNGTSYWHIHGEAGHPRSILLGYEQYSGYLQYMRSYVTWGNKYRGKGKTVIRKMTPPDGGKTESWVDLFFGDKTIYILGLSLDYVEMHLWWLIIYRARKIIQNELKNINKIYYIYPNTLGTSISDKLELLNSNGITPKSIPYSEDNRSDYYFRAIDFMNKTKQKKGYRKRG